MTTNTLTILGMFIVTFIPRIIPTLFFSRYEMPNAVKRAIKYVPVSVFSYLIATDVLFKDKQLFVSFANLKLIPAILTGIVAYRTRSIGITIGFGVVAFLAYQYSIGLF